MTTRAADGKVQPKGFLLLEECLALGHLCDSVGGHLVSVNLHTVGFDVQLRISGWMGTVEVRSI